MMKILVVIGLLIAGVWFANEQDFFQSSNSPKQDRVLIQAGDKCAGIAANAVEKIVVVVEFQRLEVAGRKARVMRQCMNDNGFVENPAWVAANNAAALKTAKETQVSEYEAFENMKRVAMYLFTPSSSQPFYWVNSKKIRPSATQ